MAGTSDLDVAYVARLARINLSEDEAKIFQRQLDDVLKYVEKLRQLDVTGIDATAHALPVFNVFRERCAARLVHSGAGVKQRSSPGKRPFYRP